MPHYTLQAREMEQALLAVDRIKAEKILNTLSEEPAIDIVEQVIVPAMESVGAGWEDGRAALSQVYMSARICERLVDRLTLFHEPLRQPQPKMAIAVLEDYHLLGKSIIHSVLRGAGYEVVDFGRIDADALAQKVKEEGIEVLLVSTLMLRAAQRVSYLQDLLGSQASKVKVIVGGAPFRFDRELWKAVGADACAAGAAELLPLIKRITGGQLS
ncbi:MAG: cobalamin-dependent protein [Candidatus Thiodiazotropha sp. (ex Dulcina madagascariensis)]|nr:cobalamin-dependent protein [Candidatus Thiodiazotropha sp. (ex Dulcina madagascariensis)]MCU7926122.1 cobalamin-dependent protein [Candidatus Thiodiazotropha sp. (ex Dulcina madagascariensis)]